MPCNFHFHFTCRLGHGWKGGGFCFVLRSPELLLGSLLIQVLFLYLTQMARTQINTSNRKMECSASLWPQQLVTALITWCTSLETSPCENSPCQPFLLLDTPLCAGLALFYASFRFICSLQPWHHCRKVRRKEKKKVNSNISDTPSLSVSSHFTCWLLSSVLTYLHGMSWVRRVIL